MKAKDEAGRDDYRRTDPLGEVNSEDTELAFKLQNSAPNDTELLKRLIERYAAELWRWVAVRLYYRNGTEPRREQILAVVQQVFAWAIQHVEQFHGQESVSGWLFLISEQILKTNTPGSWINKQIERAFRRNKLSPRSNEAGWESLYDLTEKQSTPLLLRDLFHYELAEIAQILNLEISEVHLRLVSGLKGMLQKLGVQDIDLRLFAYVDGLWQEDPEALDQFSQHLESCTLCQSSLRAVSELEKSLSESLNERWEAKALDPHELDAISQAVLVRIRQPDKPWQTKINLRQVAWMVGLSTIFVGLAILFVRLTPVEREFPQATNSASPELPELINMQPLLVSSKTEDIQTSAPQYILPSFSNDVNWAVFTELRYSQNMSDLLPVVKLYSREKNTIQVISESTSQPNRLWLFWELAPSISADGQVMVYVSAANNVNARGDPCRTQDQHACLDIYLYDRVSGSTRIISRAVDGGAADGDSLAPSISADGQWIAFWSAADNLVEGNEETCQTSLTDVICLYIYLYNIENQKIERLPVRVGPDGVDRISLSADGRFVGFTASSSYQARTFFSEGAPSLGLQGTITPTTNSAKLPVIVHASEAIVYDQLTDQYELQNQAQDGTPGNGDSASPVLSADGRYVAFASSSWNLVKQDTNEHVDVFVRDRNDGKVVLVSSTPDGWPGNNDSGSGNWGDNMIDISADGRYVIFESYATDLSQELISGDCVHDLMGCNLLYVHNMQTGQTERISALANGEFSNFPQISDDERWVSFTQTYSCHQAKVTWDVLPCSNMMLYDRQWDWRYNLTQYGEEAQSLSWTNISKLTLPWQGWEGQALPFSMSDKLVAIADQDGAIRLWDLSNKIQSFSQEQPELMIEVPGNNRFTTLAISNDNTWLAAGTDKGIVYVWDLSSGKTLFELKDQVDPIAKIVFTQDDTHLLIATLKQQWIWSIGNRQLILEAQISAGPIAVYALDIRSKGDLLATSRGDETIWLQSLPSGKAIGRWGGQGSTVVNMAFSPDGSLLATCSLNGGIELWEIREKVPSEPRLNLLNRIPTGGACGELAFSPNNGYLASAGRMGEIIIWRVPDGKEYAIAPGSAEGRLYSLAFSKAGKLLATEFEYNIILWGITPSYPTTYFNLAAENIFSDTPPLPLSTANDVPELNDHPIAGMLTVDQAAGSLLFPLILPSHLPEDLTYLGATINEDRSVWLRYVKYRQQSYEAMLYIYEKEIGDSPPPTMTVGASSMVMPVKINTETGQVMGEYVRGDWERTFWYGNGSLTWMWDANSNSQRLRWRQFGVLVAFYYQISPNYGRNLITPEQNDNITYLSTLLSQGDLVQIAEGMRWYGEEDIGLADTFPRHTGVGSLWNSGD